MLNKNYINFYIKILISNKGIKIFLILYFFCIIYKEFINGGKNMIGIIASMEEELLFIKDNMKEKREEKKGVFNFIIGKINDNEIVLSKCLTGKVFMAMSAQNMIDNYDVDLIINIGVAGGLSGEIGDVVISKDSMQTDMDVTALGYDKCEIPDINKIHFKADETIIKISKKLKKFPFNIMYGRVLTADKFINNREECAFLKREYDGILTDMESASLGEVCYVNKIPYSIIRGISDKADDTSHKDFKKNLQKACDNAGKVTLEILKMM